MTASHLEVILPFRFSNVLLDSLPSSSRKELSKLLRAISLPVGTLLYDPRTVPKHVHFITSGIASIVVSMVNSETAEVATVGREGLPEGAHLLGPAAITTKCFMQIAGTALRGDYETFRELWGQDEALRKAVLAYNQYQSTLLGQIAGCNRLHGVAPRLARWFLMAQDRTGSAELALTQAFVGEMIGSRRTTVSAVAGALQQRGLIRYSRGLVKILDRERLKSVACECYAASHELLESLYETAGQSTSEGLTEQAAGSARS